MGSIGSLGAECKAIAALIRRISASAASGRWPGAQLAATGHKPFSDGLGSEAPRRAHGPLRSFPSVVALMLGTSLFPVTKALLLERFRRVVLMLDGDDAGRQATSRIAAQLASECSVGRVVVPTGRQPDQLSSADIAALLAENLDLEDATR